METRRLEYFVRIIEAGSINRAATAIGITQPALSQHLSALEHDFKVRLLDRSPSGVTMTEAGKRLYIQAQVILRQIHTLKLEVVETAGAIAGVVALGVPPSHGATIGAAVLRRALADYPALRVQVIEDLAAGLASKLQGGILDLTLSSDRILDPALVGEALFDEELFLIASPAMNLQASTLAELAALPWIVTGSVNTIRGRLSAVFAEANLEPNIVAETNSLPLVIRAVQDGLGVTLLPTGAFADALASGSVVALPFTTPSPRRTIYLYRRRDKSPSAAEDAVRQMVLAACAQLGMSA
jgi:DNA-binding transcriptional LysR family regulator